MNTRMFPAASVVLLATLACHDDPESPTGPVQPSGPEASAAAAGALSFYQVSGGDGHTCGVTTDSLAYCWGYNESGQLGTGTVGGPESCAGAVGPFACSTRPVAVVGGHRFRAVSAGGHNTCGITGDFRLYCWGAGSQVGDGTSTDRPRPVAIGGSIRFRGVDVGDFHTCGLSQADNRAYCWGLNPFGELGDGTLESRLSPVAVRLGLRFHQLSVGQWHSCGATTSGPAYCWGRNREGQLGDSTNVRQRTRPSRVVGPTDFRQIDAGGDHTCAVTTAHTAWCWGDGRDGEIGNGRAYLSFWPRAVAGGLSFGRVSAGHFFSCGETTTNRVYCWGSNSLGELGDGTGIDRLRPVQVAGGLFFSQMNAGDWHACARTPSGAAYCWGYGFFGALGNGSSGFGSNALAPTAVLGPE